MNPKAYMAMILVLAMATLVGCELNENSNVDQQDAEYDIYAPESEEARLMAEGDVELLSCVCDPGLSRSFCTCEVNEGPSIHGLKGDVPEGPSIEAPCVCDPEASDECTCELGEGPSIEAPKDGVPEGPSIETPCVCDPEANDECTCEVSEGPSVWGPEQEEEPGMITTLPEGPSIEAPCVCDEQTSPFCECQEAGEGPSIQAPGKDSEGPSISGPVLPGRQAPAPESPFSTTSDDLPCLCDNVSMECICWVNPLMTNE